MTDRYLDLPHQELAEEDRSNQCTLGGEPQIHWQTHKQEVLHAAREIAVRYAP